MMTQDLGFAGLPLGCLKDVDLFYIPFLAAASLLKSKILKNFYYLRYRHCNKCYFYQLYFLTLISLFLNIHLFYLYECVYMYICVPCVVVSLEASKGRWNLVQWL